MQYDTAVEKLYSLQKFGIKLGLEKILSFLEYLGNPQQSFISFHVAGTNGKGTAAAAAASVLTAHGIRTGLYTSPNLIDLRERFTIDSLPPSKEYVSNWVEKHWPYIVGNRVTFFETVTALAFDWFREMGVAAACVEVGLGGRFDATNVLTPAVSAISSIALDHARYLGSDLVSIAAEKAGIAKSGVPLVCGPVSAPVKKRIEGICREKGAQFIELSSAVNSTILEQIPSGQVFNFKSAAMDAERLRLNIHGRHHVTNASLGIYCAQRMLEAFATPLNAEAVHAGMNDLCWPGRFQTLETKEGVKIVIDVAHNPKAASALADTFKTVFGREAKAVFIAALGGEKACGAFFRPLLALAENFYLPSVDFGRAESRAAQLDRKKIAHYLDSKDTRYFYADSMGIALDNAVAEAGETGLPVVVCGSFHTAGESLNLLNYKIKGF